MALAFFAATFWSARFAPNWKFIFSLFRKCRWFAQRGSLVALLTSTCCEMPESNWPVVEGTRWTSKDIQDLAKVNVLLFSNSKSLFSVCSLFCSLSVSLFRFFRQKRSKAYRGWPLSKIWSQIRSVGVGFWTCQFPPGNFYRREKKDVDFCQEKGDEGGRPLSRHNAESLAYPRRVARELIFCVCKFEREAR